MYPCVPLWQVQVYEITHPTPDDGPGVHGEPDREESGDFGDGDHPSQDQNGIRNSAHSIPDHQLDVGVQQR